MDYIQHNQFTSVLSVIRHFIGDKRDPPNPLRSSHTWLTLSTHLDYLSDTEAEDIREQFESFSDCQLVFWSGIRREQAQRWADKRGLFTLTTLMGPLMEPANPRCPKKSKSPKAWSTYVKGAAIMFAQYACGAGIIRLLTLPPPERDNLRAESTFLTLEEPILKGKAGECRALRIIYTHPMVPGAEGFAYELWPNDCTSDWLQHYETEGKEINEAKVAENAKKATIATNTAEATIAVRPMEAKGGKAASSALIKVKKKKKKTKKAKKAKKATASAEATGVKKTRRGKEEQKAKRAKKVPEAKKEKKAK